MRAMKTYKILSCAVAFVTAMTITSCVGDLDVTPIDPNLSTANNALTSAASYNSLLAKCYSGLSVSSPDGSSGNPDISGIDGGFGQYMRALYYMNELTTDEAVIGWNDQTIKDLHGLSWSSSDVFVSAMYSRLFYQITLCSDIIQELKSASVLDDATKTQYISEARCLRALSYYHAIDMFGNVPFVTELSGSLPKQITRADLYTWLITEINDFADKLPAQPEKYRCGQGMAHMLLAKLYLNAKIYTGTADYANCVKECEKVINLGYALDTSYSSLFNGQNDKRLACKENGMNHEIIFSVYQDEYNTQNYGGSTFIGLAAMGGKMTPADYGFTASGWGGLRVTPEFVNKFDKSDVRAKSFFTNGQTLDITDIGTFSNGYAFMKFTDLNDNGTGGTQGNFCNADIPIFRLADVYLMLAECQIVGGQSVSVAGHNGLYYYNLVRARAGLTTPATSLLANDILNERARELAWECCRRSDLVRFGKLTTADYVWQWKGNTHDGKAVDNKYNLFPIPSTDINSNTNLTQNSGY